MEDRSEGGEFDSPLEYETPILQYVTFGDDGSHMEHAHTDEFGGPVNVL